MCTLKFQKPWYSGKNASLEASRRGPRASFALCCVTLGKSLLALGDPISAKWGGGNNFSKAPLPLTEKLCLEQVNVSWRSHLALGTNHPNCIGPADLLESRVF